MQRKVDSALTDLQHMYFDPVSLQALKDPMVAEPKALVKMGLRPSGRVLTTVRFMGTDSKDQLGEPSPRSRAPDLWRIGFFKACPRNIDREPLWAPLLSDRPSMCSLGVSCTREANLQASWATGPLTHLLFEDSSTSSNRLADLFMSVVRVLEIRGSAALREGFDDGVGTAAIRARDAPLSVALGGGVHR